MTASQHTIAGTVHSLDVLAQPGGVLGQQDRDQLGNVLAAVAQRCKMNRDHVQAIVQIFPKPPGGDLSE